MEMSTVSVSLMSTDTSEEEAVIFGSSMLWTDEMRVAMRRREVRYSSFVDQVNWINITSQEE